MRDSEGSIQRDPQHSGCKDVTAAVLSFEKIPCFSRIKTTMTNQPNLLDDIIGVGHLLSPQSSTLS